VALPPSLALFQRPQSRGIGAVERQEQLVLLLLTAIVTYLIRGQMKAGVMSSMNSIATRSARLQADISNKKLATWLAKNEEKLLHNQNSIFKRPLPSNRQNLSRFRYSNADLHPLKQSKSPPPLSTGLYLHKQIYRDGLLEN